MDKLQEILRSIRPEFEFTEADDFMDQGMLDSFDVLTLVAELEKVFTISIDGIDILPVHFRSLGAIRQLLGRYGVSSWT